jgi:hypothetical protein
MDIEELRSPVQLSVSMIYVKYCQQRAQRKRPETRRIWYNEELENVWNIKNSKKDCFSLIIELKSGISK